MKIILGFSLCLFLIACLEERPANVSISKQPQKDSLVIYTQPSSLKNQYLNFNSPNAINRLAVIENEYFNHFQDSISRYYGTEWRASAFSEYQIDDSLSNFEIYTNQLKNIGIKADSMHCTIYAFEALSAGLDSNIKTLEKHHIKIWKDREHAGWSVARILVNEFNWKAYIFISENSNEYKRCVKNFKSDSLYWVWKQPDIPLSGFYNFDKDQNKIDTILLKNEFGWGFSDQGYHTWVTRFDTLKECNWSGTPGSKFDQHGIPLFKKTKFTSYTDYTSHIIVFPPKSKPQDTTETSTYIKLKELGYGTDMNRLNKIAKFYYTDIRSGNVKIKEGIQFSILKLETCNFYKLAKRYSKESIIKESLRNGKGYFFTKIDSRGKALKNAFDFQIQIWDYKDVNLKALKKIWKKAYENMPVLVEVKNDKLFLFTTRSSNQYEYLLKIKDNLF